jgi:hypothetical protein
MRKIFLIYQCREEVEFYSLTKRPLNYNYMALYVSRLMQGSTVQFSAVPFSTAPRFGTKVSSAVTVRGAGDRCCHFRISTCTVFISESVVAPLLTPATGARRRQQSLPAERGQLHCPGPSSNPGWGACDFFLVAL